MSAVRRTDLLAQLQREIRREGLRATPYRVGVKAGQARLPLPSPYPSVHATRHYDAGHARGLGA